jgi:hypothetical protein
LPKFLPSISLIAFSESFARVMTESPQQVLCN